MDEATRNTVRQRAADRCEYCLLPQQASPLFTFHVDHVIAKQHVADVADDPDSLCLACNRCNAYKGTNLSSVDPDTKQIVPLYNPREHPWLDHFVFHGTHIVGITPTGRATVRLLHMNAPHRAELRQEWIRNHGPLA